MVPVRGIPKIALCILLWCSVFPVSLLIALIPVTVFLSYRLVITQLLRPILRPDLVSPLSSIDSAFSFDDFHGMPRGPLGIMMTVDGNLRQDVVEERLSAALSNAPEGYKRLTSLCVTFWLGYPFWTRLSRKFKTTNHLKVAEGRNPRDSVKKWLGSAFAPGQPLWDCLLVPGHKDGDGAIKSILAIRWHHMVGDGISLLHFVAKGILEHGEMYLEENIQQLSFYERLLKKATDMFWTPLVFCEEIYDTTLSSDALSSRDRSPEYFSIHFSVPVADIAALRQRCFRESKRRVSFVNIILLCLTGTFRRVFLSDLAQNSNDLKHVNISVADSLSQIHPSVQSHYIGNHWGICLTKLPITESNPSNRLESLIEQEEWMDQSGSLETNLLLAKLLSILPNALYSPLIQSLRGTTCGITLAPPTSDKTLCGLPVSSFLGLGGIQGKQTSMSLAVVSYQSKVNVSGAIDCNVFPANATLFKIGEYFAAEVKQLLESEWQ